MPSGRFGAGDWGSGARVDGRGGRGGRAAGPPTCSFPIPAGVVSGVLETFQIQAAVAFVDLLVLSGF